MTVLYHLVRMPYYLARLTMRGLSILFVTLPFTVIILFVTSFFVAIVYGAQDAERVGNTYYVIKKGHRRVKTTRRAYDIIKLMWQLGGYTFLQVLIISVGFKLSDELMNSSSEASQEIGGDFGWLPLILILESERRRSLKGDGVQDEPKPYWWPDELK